MNKPCRHEYVLIFQRKLKDLERRLVKTKAYLPIGFTPNDFNHLSLPSYCFCAKCRFRLFPKPKKSKILMDPDKEKMAISFDKELDKETDDDTVEDTASYKFQNILLSDLIMDDYNDIEIKNNEWSQED